MKFKDIIKEARKKKKLRQEDVGNLINRSQGNISAIERNEIPKFDIACFLCEVLDLDIQTVWNEIKNDFLEEEKIEYEKRDMED